jgi:putative transposase
MHYRRLMTPGATYFFTVVTYRRRAFLCEPDSVALLREAFATVKQRYPFRIEAMVLLPDHLHCLWTLPAGDSNYATRWMLIKAYFTRRCAARLKTAGLPALRHKREQTI